LVPTHRRYRALQAALALAARRELGPQPLIGDPPYEVRVGVTAPEVATLRDRLLLEGYGDASVTGKLRAYFDHRLKRALWKWQQDHGLPVTVVLDPLTRRRLDEPLPNEVRALAVALRRWRRLDLREDRGRQIVVHLNAYRLEADEDGREKVAMKVIIGRATAVDATPAMSAPLDAVVTNPDWRVPRRIVEESMRARAADDPAALEAEGYEVKVGKGGEWLVRQPPGPDNPLGVLKFRLRGTDGVYLHDTSAPKLFKKEARALSHGCVRLERPRELAAWLVPERRADVTGELSGGPTERIPVEPAATVHFLYATTAVDAAGRVEHFPDVYGRDAEEAPVDVAALVKALATE
ncbi:MAG: L,D-transpeptidase family protein, partial [Myxococcales bacterium]|nr:L,D-transpeptidase family protein [Myxococcales bacterium]